jgi:crossover junction endodeoxyribonuclease RuvC
MRILGIDPGASGALAIVDLTQPGRVEIFDMPSVQVKRGTRMVNQVSAPMLAEILREKLIDFAVLEKVGAMPGQGVSSMFAFGRAAGVVEGVLAGLEIAVTLVTPQEWQKHMRVVGGKDGARSRASQIFSKDVNYFLRKKDDGRADAALIASYGSTFIK